MLVRPHDFAIRRAHPPEGGIAAEVIRVLTSGSLVKIELVDESRTLLYVHQSHAEYVADPVKVQDKVWLIATSQRIFRNGEDWSGDYVI